MIAAHEVLPNFFLLSGHTPISVRDQLLRARLLIDRLVDRGRLAKGKKGELLVVGGGAAGMTAALRAAEHGIDTRLVEKRAFLFGTQKWAQTRYLCPTQYDWPLDHYLVGQYAYPPYQLPTLNVDAVEAPPTGAELAVSWREQANFGDKILEARSIAGPEIHYNTRVVNPVEVDGKLLKVHFRSRSAGETLASTEVAEIETIETFPAIIWAAGFGKERCTLYRKNLVNTPDGVKWREITDDPSKPPYYVGRAFWSYDKLIGLSSNHRVLVAGGGDGGLQDMLRVVIDMRIAREVLHALNVPTDLTSAILSAEARLTSARMWHDGKRKGWHSSYMSELESFHRSQIDAALNDKFDKTFYNTVANFFKKRSIPRTLLVYPETYLPAYYALNRFLVLLIDEYFKIAEAGISQRTVELRPGARLSALETSSKAELWELVKDRDGAPGNDGKPRKVWRAKGTYEGEILRTALADEGHWFEPRFVDPDDDGKPLHFPKEQFDRIILRFGHEGEPLTLPPEPPPLPPKQLPALSWHMLPSHLPR